MKLGTRFERIRRHGRRSADEAHFDQPVQADLRNRGRPSVGYGGRGRRAPEWTLGRLDRSAGLSGVEYFEETSDY